MAKISVRSRDQAKNALDEAIKCAHINPSQRNFSHLNTYERKEADLEKEEESFGDALKRALKVNLLGVSPFWLGIPAYLLLLSAANSLGYNVPYLRMSERALIISIAMPLFSVVATALFSPLLLLRRYLPKREFIRDLTYGLLTFTPLMAYLMLSRMPRTTSAVNLVAAFIGSSIFPILGAIIKAGLRSLGNKLMHVHSSVRKTLLALLVVAILFSLLLVAGALIYLIYKPSFEVRSIMIADHGGYPSLKISFSTDAYPVTFHLLTPEGEEMGSCIAEKPEEVVYLNLSGLHTNIIGPKTYLLKVFYKDLLLLDYNITIGGARAYLKIVSVTTRAEPSGLGVKIIAEVENTGDVPLYLHKENIRLCLDNETLPFTLKKGITLNPYRAAELEIYSLIDTGKLNKGYRIVLSIPHLAQDLYVIVDPSWVSNFIAIANKYRSQEGASPLQYCPWLSSFAHVRFRTQISNPIISHYGFDQDWQRYLGYLGSSVLIGEEMLGPGDEEPSDYVQHLITKAPNHWKELIDPNYTYYGYYLGNGPGYVSLYPCPVHEINASGINIVQLYQQFGCNYTLTNVTYFVVELSDWCSGSITSTLYEFSEPLQSQYYLDLPILRNLTTSEPYVLLGIHVKSAEPIRLFIFTPDQYDYFRSLYRNQVWDFTGPAYYYGGESTMFDSRVQLSASQLAGGGYHLVISNVLPNARDALITVKVTLMYTPNQPSIPSPPG
jgi:hypothetical protein